MRKRFVFAAILALTMTMAAQAVVPPLVNYQGFLRSSVPPRNPVNGTFDITFRLYNQPTGGTPFWTEIHLSHVVTNGELSVILGSLTLFSTATPTSNDIWMGITIGTDPELSPRTQWVSVPFAFQADRADTAQYARQTGTVDTASFAFTSRNSDTADYAWRSLFSDTADYAGRSLFSDTADIAKGATNNSIGSAQLIDKNVTAQDMADSTIVGVKIAKKTIFGSHLVLGAVNSEKIENGTIQLEDFSDMGATDGQIMKWDQSSTSWIVDNDEAGTTGSDGWIDDGTVVRLTDITDSVGIGTATPAEKLDVAGNIHASGTIISGNSITIDGATDKITASSGTIDFDDENIVTTGKATIGPGHTNTGENAFVAGFNNVVSGKRATVGGGTGNTASGIQSTVAGGSSNIASDSGTTVSGGRMNTASGLRSVVGGGESNISSDSATTVSGGSLNTAAAVYSTVSGGLNNANLSGARFAIIAGGQNNQITARSGVITGGSGNVVSGDHSIIGGGLDNSATGTISVIGGGHNNFSSSTGTTIGGGRWNDATGIFSTVGGGTLNAANGNNSTVCGGLGDTVTADHGFIGGGRLNIAGNAAVVCGGLFNSATGSASILVGGTENTASGEFAMILGGSDNLASGRTSFAAGRHAKATHDGSFVWADENNADFASSALNQFNIRASGGTRIYSNSALTAGVTMAAGASSWSAVSDSALKRNVREVDYHEVLEKVAALPISQWSYEAQDESIEHIGPMAQDFYRLFGLGEDDKHINTLDPDGVALAAIKALYEKSKRVDALVKSNKELNDRLSKLEEMIETLGKK